MKDQRKSDEKFMTRALELAAKGIGTTTPNPMVGAVIVKDGRIIGEGYHKRAGEPHAEVNALDSICEPDTAEGATIYVTLEPCSHHGRTPPCADRIIKEKLARVVVATTDPNPKVAGRGIERIRMAGIQVDVGLMAVESEKLNEIFNKYIVTKKPFVVFKAAMSLDGKIATASGESRWISCEESRNETHRLRHRLTGVMVGIGTVLADDPMLNCRIPETKQPIRIVADSRLRMPMEAKLVKSAKEFPLIIVTTENADAKKRELLEASGAKVISVASAENENGKVDMQAMMRELGRCGIDSILLEGGGTLAENALRAGIIDKVMFYLAPKIIGGESAKTPVEGEGILPLDCALKIRDMEITQVGCDIRITGYLREVKRCLPE